jgi:hypothetical protein
MILSESLSTANTPLVIKNTLLDAAKSKNLLKATADPADYLLKIVGVQCYITNDTLALRRHNFIQICRKSFVNPAMELVPKEVAQQPLTEVIDKERERERERANHPIQLLLTHPAFFVC